jgi:hypothetical protein
MRKNLALVAVVAILLSGCASSEKHLRSQPASFISDFSPTQGPLKGLVTLECLEVRTHAKPQRNKRIGEPEPECLYLTADITKLVDRLPGDDSAPKIAEGFNNKQFRDSLLFLLLGISDYNCSNFLNRAYAVRSTLDASGKLTGDLASAISAGTVTVAPGVSAGLDAISLLATKSSQDFSTVFYFDKTFQALEAAVQAQRIKRKTQIIANKGRPDYSLMDAISDARFYDDACSIKMGLQELQNIAEDEKKTSEDVNLKVQKVSEDKRLDTYMSLQPNAVQPNVSKPPA